MAIPAESASHVVASHGLVTRDNVLDGAGQDVAIVREASGEGRTVVKDVFWHGFGPFQLSLESFDFGPEGEDPLFLLRE